jgi:O-antigen ligase
VLALALSGGGYDVVIRGQIGLAAWWVVLIGSAAGLLPAARLARPAWIAVALLAGFALWTGLSALWSASAELTLKELARAGYLGWFVLGLVAVRAGSATQLIRGVAAALGLVGLLAVLSRLTPAAFPTNPLLEFFPGATRRLAYPLQDADATAELLAIGLPLLLACAAAEVNRAGRAVAAAAVPVTVLAIILTASRGAVLAALVGTAMFFALRHERSAKRPRRPTPVRGRSRLLGLAGLVSVVLAGLALGAPAELARQWRAFQRPGVAASAQGDVLGRLTTVAGSDRYQFWVAAWRAFEHRPLLGIGPGTFAFWWERHASTYEHVINAHSLYLETLAETGLVGLAALLGFIGVVLVSGIAASTRPRGSQRAYLAGAGAGFIAFVLAAGYDWVWQIAALPVTALLLGAALLGAESDRGRRRADGWALGVLACLATFGVAVPLAEQAQLAVSQGDVAAGRFVGALRAAATARGIEPFAVGPTLQQALILERLGVLHRARATLGRSIAEMPTDWQLWVIAARLDAELHDAADARTALHRARSLNPRSPATAGAIVNGPHGSVQAPASLLGLGTCVPSGVSDLVQSVETIPPLRARSPIRACGNVRPIGGSSPNPLPQRTLPGRWARLGRWECWRRWRAEQDRAGWGPRHPYTSR